MLFPKPMHLLLFTCLLLFQTHIKAQGPIFNWCDGPSNYTSNSQFDTNLNRLLSSLITNTLPTRFYNASLGQNPDRVHILSQCTARISEHDCRSCLYNSSVEILRRCPNRKDAIIRYDYCVLRYSNQSFFSRVNASIRFEASSIYNVTDPVFFNRQLGSLMRNLSESAASDESKFQTGVTDFTGVSNIYGLVQCTRDLSSGDCSSCIEILRNRLPVCCDSKIGAGITTFSCNIRYEIYPFYEAWLGEPSVAESPPPPPPVNGTSLEGRENSSSAVLIIVVVVVVISLVLISTVCVCLWRRKRVKKAVDVRKSEDNMSAAESLLFDLGTLRTATNDFSIANKLGEGGFGPVYKVIFSLSFIFDASYAYEVTSELLHRCKANNLYFEWDDVIWQAGFVETKYRRLTWHDVIGCKCCGVQAMQIGAVSHVAPHQPHALCLYKTCMWLAIFLLSGRVSKWTSNSS